MRGKRNGLMCGITGFTGNGEGRAALLRRMTDKIIHRGPDSNGYYIEDGIAAGFRRLSIIDITSSGDQPILNEDGTKVITFNGEIYNYQELTAELKAAGHVFRTRTDTEAILHGYEEWGEQVLARLRGMFSFAIWDVESRELFLARDFFGIKPLYYTERNQELIYGSEIQSILEYPGVERRVDLDALDAYLSFEYVVPPATMFEGILSLLPGHFMRWSREKGVRIQRYFSLEFDAQPMSLENAVSQISDVFSQSVSAHRIADVEVGCFLSGGIDSSYVASFFEGQKTFTVGFAYNRYNECAFSKELAARIGTDHHEKLITPEEYWGSIRHVVYHLGQPCADASTVGLYHVSRLASQYVKVVLSGEGADELFGGYNIYREPDDLAGFQHRIPLSVRKEMSKLADAIPVPFKGKNFLHRASRPLEDWFIGNCSMISLEEKRKLLLDKVTVRDPGLLTKAYYEKVKDKDDLTKMQYLDLNVWMVGDILLKSDRMSMANSLELRVPFLDREVWELARKLPKELRVGDGMTKRALRHAAERRLPSQTAYRRKLGFPVPIRVWLQEKPYYSRVREFFESRTAVEFFNVHELCRLLDEHRSGKADNSRAIWTILIFLVWYDIYFDGGSHEYGAEL